MSDCLFCRIASKEQKADLVYEDQEIVAFRDIHAQAPTHILLIPRKHIPLLLDLTPEDEPLIGRLYSIANQLAEKEKIADRGFRIVANCREEAGQSVFHIHLHLLGGRPMKWPPG